MFAAIFEPNPPGDAATKGHDIAIFGGIVMDDNGDAIKGTVSEVFGMGGTLAHKQLHKFSANVQVHLGCLIVVAGEPQKERGKHFRGQRAGFS
jgi:hypothetical protein